MNLPLCRAYRSRSTSRRAVSALASLVAAACAASAHAEGSAGEPFAFSPSAADPAMLDLSRVGLVGADARAGSPVAPFDARGETGVQETGVRETGVQETGVQEKGVGGMNTGEMRPYGSADSVEIEFAFGGGGDFDGTTLGIAGVGVHWFVADGVSFGVLAEGLWFDDGANDAFGGGAALVARWHFVRGRDHSFFIEGGCGFAGFTDVVPAGGTDYDFTPRAALGFTYALDEGVRLVGRAGWFHISNGQTGPGNPGFDSATISLGLSFTLGN